MAQIFGDSKTQLAMPPAPADPALSRGVGPDGLQLVPTSSPAPALHRGNISSQAVSKLLLQSHMAHVKHLPRVKSQPRLLHAALVFKRGQSPSLGGRQGRGCSDAPLCWRGGKQKQQRADRASRTLSRLFDFWPGKHSRSGELLPAREKRKGWAQGPWHRAACQAWRTSVSSAPGRFFGRGLGRPGPQPQGIC